MINGIVAAMDLSIQHISTRKDLGHDGRDIIPARTGA
jgi:hypothetical protein